MKDHHTKTKGDLGVLKAQVDLFEQGYLPLLPQTEHSSFDLVGYKEGVFKRIQVKYRSVDSKGVLAVHFQSSWADKNGNHFVPVNKDDVDLYCVYCPDTDKCYWFDPSEFGSSVNLRIRSPKNHQKKSVILADDYRKIP